MNNASDKGARASSGARRHALLHVFLLMAAVASLAGQDLESVLRSYSNSPAQNNFLWQNLGALRARGNVPPAVEKGLNAYRVQAVRAAREAVVRDMMASGRFGDKALAGFINTGTWNDPKVFKVKSDVDFTAVGRDPKAVKEFQQRFYQKLGTQVGVPPSRVIKQLDVNCYSLGGLEPGAYRTPGGRRFFEVYSAQKGGYEAITGRGANAVVQRSHIDNAFIDMGKKVPRFTPGDAAMFAGELRGQMRQNAAALRGSIAKEATANAKLIERVAYANAVAEGQVMSKAAASQLVREANAMRAGQKLEEALAGRISNLMAGGMSKQQAVQAATRQFVNESRNYVEHSTAQLAQRAVQAERAQLAKTEGMLAKLSGGKLAVGALKVGVGALTLYMLNDAYQREGGAGLAKELVRQGLYTQFPPAVLAQLAGLGVQVGGQALMNYANQCKSNAVIGSMFGDSAESMLAFYNSYRNPEKLRAYIEREWSEQDQYGGAYFGRGLSNAEVKELVFDQARAVMLEITSRLREEKQKEERILRELKEMVRKEDALLKAAEEDQELAAELRELQSEQEEEFREKEVAQAEQSERLQEVAGDAVAEEEGLLGRLARVVRRNREKTELEPEANKAEAAGSGSAEDREEEPPPESAGVAPNLVRTRWVGRIAMQEVADEEVAGRMVLSVEFSVDDYNRITGSARFPAVAGSGFRDDPGLRDVPVEGRYDSRSGRLEATLRHVQRSAPFAEFAGIPLVEECRLEGKISGTAESGDVLTGDIKAKITVSKRPGRAYTEEEIQAWAASWWRSNRPNDRANADNIAHTANQAREVLSQTDDYDEPLTATWRAERQR